MRNVVAAFIAVLLVFPLFLAALVTTAVSTGALDRELYARTLGDERLYEIPARFPASAMWSLTWIPGLDRVPPQALSTALREVITPPYVRSQVLRTMNDAFDFLEGRSPVLDPYLDLRPLKSLLSGQEGRRFARVLAESLPICGKGAPFIDKPGTLPGCRPSDISVASATQQIEADLPALMKKLPDRLRLADSPAPVAAAAVGFPGFPVLRALIIADIVLLLAAGGFWILAGFTGGAEARRRLQWLGWSLFAPSVIVFLIGLSVTLATGTPGFIRNTIVDAISSASFEGFGYSKGFYRAVLDASRAFLFRLSVGFLATGAIAVGASFGLLGWSWSMPKETKRPAAAA